MDSTYCQAMDMVSFIQTWPGHFLAKKIETEIILKYFERNEIKNDIGLDIGCGNGFQSALLAGFTGRLVATDLFNENGLSHTVGMQKAKKLIETLQKKNILLVSCSSLALPFPDNCFDFVFCSSALEHMDDKDMALKEIRRVLKPDGHAVIVVPTHMPSLYAFIHVYLYCIARVLKLIFRTDDKLNKAGQVNRSQLLDRFMKNRPSFPMPEPHGAYKNIFYELFSQLPFSWERLFRRNGFRIRSSFGICVFPWLFIEPFSTMAAARIYLATKNINKKSASCPAVKYISYLIGIVAVKETKIGIHAE